MTPDFMFIVSEVIAIVAVLLAFIFQYIESLKTFQVSLKEEGVSLLVDIGNGSITGAFVLFNKNTKPRFLYSVTMPFLVLEKPSALRLSDNMNALLNSILTSVMKHGWKELGGSAKLSRVMVSFSSPWFILKTKEIHISEPNAFLVTKAFINNVISKEEVLFKKELSKDFSVGPDSFNMIDRSVVHTKINGYVVGNIIGRKAEVFDASVFISAVAKDVENKVTNNILKHTHLSDGKISMHVFPFILFSAVRDNFTKDSSFLLMDITSEVTDITLVAGDVIVRTATMPIGRNSIVRQIMKVFHISAELAESQFSMYTSNKVTSSVSTTMQNLLIDIEKEWAVYFEDVFSTLSSDAGLPKTIYITGSPDTTPIFIDFLKITKFDTTSGFRKNLKMVYINKEALSGLYQTSSKSPEDEFITILAIFYNKIIQNQ